MLKYLTIFSILFSFCIMTNVQAEENIDEPKKEKVTLLLKCEKTKGIVKNRLNNINDKLTDTNNWKTYKNESFYFVAFGTNWEEVEETCYAHPAYIEIETYSTVLPYVEKLECLRGPFGKGTQEFFDSWGDYFKGELINTFIKSKDSCNIKARYIYYASKVDRMERSARKNCELSRRHFLNLIQDAGYGKSKADYEWQEQKCKEITVKEFEEKTGLYVKELEETIAEDVI